MNSDTVAQLQEALEQARHEASKWAEMVTTIEHAFMSYDEDFQREILSDYWGTYTNVSDLLPH